MTMLKSYLSRHLQVCVASLGDIMRRPISNSMIIIVIAITLALPAGLYVILQNAKQLNHRWDKSSQIFLYLKLNTDQATIDSLIKQWQQNPDIADIQYISPQQGMAEFQQQSGFGDALKELKENPLPPVLMVTPKVAFDSSHLNNLLNMLKLSPQVDVAQFDRDWVERFSNIIQLLQRCVVVLGILLCIAVIFIIGNTMHLVIENRHREIEVLRLIGATQAFIRRPFLYTGVLYGFLGGLLAWIVVNFVLFWIKPSVQHLAISYGSVFNLQGLGFASGFNLLLLSMLLGWFAGRSAL